MENNTQKSQALTHLNPKPVLRHARHAAFQQQE